MQKKRGFTLIELLIVIGIIAILAAIIFVAVDPARRLAEARNAERWSSVNSLLNAYLQYTVDNQGTEPVSLTPGTYYMITNNCVSDCASGCSAQNTTSNISLSPLVDAYLSSIPKDPKNGTTQKSYYYIRKTTAGRVTIGACTPEAVGGTTPTISVSR